jgi:hypothetical protein
MSGSTTVPANARYCSSTLLAFWKAVRDRSIVFPCASWSRTSLFGQSGH